MNKQELVSAIAGKTGGTKKDAELALNAFVEVVTEALAEGGEVNLVGFGKFLTRERAERNGRNPATGEPLQIPATTTAAFKVGSKLREAVRGSN